MLIRTCPGCGYKGGAYDFSPSIEIGPDDFRIFHMYNKMQGPLYCNQCKRKHLLAIASEKNLNNDQKEFLKNKIETEKDKFKII